MNRRCGGMADTMAEKSREQPLCHVFHLVIPNKKRDCMVGEIMANGLLRLPRVKLPSSIKFPYPGKEDEIERYVETQLGICGYIARSLCNGQDRQIEGVDDVEEHGILLFDIVDDQDALQRPLKWIGRDIACKRAWVPTNGDGYEHHVNDLLEDLFTEINGEETEPEEELTYEAWERVGWYEDVMSWTRKVLEANNMLMKGRIRHVQSSYASLVMSCEVQVGQNGEVGYQNVSDVVFIKASVPSEREAQRTATIRKVIGNIVPEVMGIDETGGIMIQRNGGMVTGELWNQEDLINTILRMQSLSVNRISELEAGGVVVADSQWIEMNVERILNHELFDECWKHGGIEEETNMRKMQVEELRSRVSAIQKGCRQVTSLDLPRTIVHGDLNITNVGSPLKEKGNMYRFFDWTESFIGNPLHDVQRLLRANHIKFASIDYEAGIRQVYEHWKPCGTLEEMKAVFPLLTEMSDVITLFHFTQRYNACGPDDDKRKYALLYHVQETIELLTFENGSV